MNKQMLLNNDIKTEQELHIYVKEVFESFDCETDDIFLDSDSGDFKFILEENTLIPIDKVTIIIMCNHTAENYQRILDTLDYIEDDDQIEFGAVNAVFR